MDYRRLGRSGLKVSELCLGTMTFDHGTDQEEATRMVDLIFAAGVNFSDTAIAIGIGRVRNSTGQRPQRTVPGRHYRDKGVQPDGAKSQ